MVSDYITNALKDHLCPLLQQQLDPTITSYLQTFNRWAKKYIGPSTHTRVETMAESSSSTPTATGAKINAAKAFDSDTFEKAVDSRSDFSDREPSQSQSRKLMTSTFTAMSNTIRNTTNKTVKFVQEYESIRWILQVVNEQLNEHLQRPWLPIGIPPGDEDDKNDCRNIFRGISGWLHSIFGNRITIELPPYFHDIKFSISIEELNVKASIRIDLQNVSVEGFDTMDQIQIMSPTATLTPSSGYQYKNGSALQTNATLKSSLKSETGFFLILPTLFTINLTKITDDDESRLHLTVPPLKESFLVAINVTNVDIKMSNIVRVVDWDDTSLLDVVDAIQSFVDLRNIDDLAPLFKTLNDIRISEWLPSLLVDSIAISRNNPTPSTLVNTTSSSLEQDVDQVVNNILKLATSEYQELWTALTGSLVHGPGRRALNRYIQDWLHQFQVSSLTGSEGRPRQISSLRSDTYQQPKSKLVNFTKFEILKHLNQFLEFSHTKRTLNHFLRCVGHSFDRSDYANSSIFSFSPSNDGSENVILRSINTMNWDSIDELQLFKPLSDLRLGSSLIVGSTRTDSTAPSILVGVTLEGPSIAGDVNITAFGSVAVAVVSQVVYDVNLLQNLSISHFVEQITCSLIAANEIRLIPDATNVKFGDALGINISGIINGRKLSFSTGDNPSVNESVATVIDWAVEWIRSITNKAAYEWTHLAFQQCPGVVSDGRNVPPHDNDEPSSMSSVWSTIELWSPLLVAFVLLQGGLVLVARSIQSLHPSYPNRLVSPSPSPNTEDELSHSDMDEQMRPIDSDIPMLSTCEDIMRPFSSSFELLKNAQSPDHSILHEIYHELNETNENVVLERQFLQLLESPLPSLFMNERLPGLIRFLVPMLIVGTLTLLLSSNVSVGASVDLSLYFNGRFVEIPSLFKFSLASTVSELYGAHIYLLLAIVVVFSGIWPYVKLASLLQVWMVPTLSPSELEKRLLMLDALGKFSLVSPNIDNWTPALRTLTG
jgi:hypothetical protein